MFKIDKLKKHLLDGKLITVDLSIKMWGYQRLSDGIYKLRNMGIDIKTVLHQNPKTKTRYAVYFGVAVTKKDEK